MKRLISVFLMCAVSVLLAVPCFAADTAKFNINVISESNSEIKISIDFEGGTAFACYDFELKYNEKKLSAVSAIEGKGWDSFAKNTKLNGGAVISTVNPNGNPILGTCATTEAFKVVDGKDLVTATFKKLTKDKVEASDITLKFTNCQTADFRNIKTSVTSSLSAGTEAVSVPSEQKNDKSTEKPGQSEASSQQTEGESTETERQTADTNHCVQDEPFTEEVETTDENDGRTTKKIVVVAAAAVIMLFIIVGICAYVAKKAKNDTK